MIDKYIGDVVEAIWAQPDTDAQLACESALDQMAAMNDFHMWATDHGFPCPSLRIGINSGLMRMGEFGTKYRRSFTAMGDNVNLASRLEGINRSYGTRIMISGPTRKRLSQDMVVRPIDRVRVMGRDEPLEIFELLCRATELSPQQIEFLDAYGRALAQYFDEDFTAALSSFERAEQMSPGDGPCEIFATRCRYVLKQPLDAR
jgi:adenylate cyclase